MASTANVWVKQPDLTRPALHPGNGQKARLKNKINGLLFRPSYDVPNRVVSPKVVKPTAYSPWCE